MLSSCTIYMCVIFPTHTHTYIHMHMHTWYAPCRGIDYMLQARLADGRAKEAEQKLQSKSSYYFKSGTVHQVFQANFYLFLFLFIFYN